LIDVVIPRDKNIKIKLFNGQGESFAQFKADGFK